MDFNEVVGKWNERIDELAKFQSDSIILTETDTRCLIIDPILSEILGWKAEYISREPKVESGYIDYYIKNDFNKYILEAKRTSVPFKMPRGKNIVNSKNISKSCSDLYSAIEQARNYAREKDCRFCVVSNGLNIAITKTFPLDKENDTVVFAGKEALTNNLNVLYEVLSPYKNGELFFDDILKTAGNIRLPSQFQKKILTEQYDMNKSIRANGLSFLLRPYLVDVFGDLTAENKLEILEHTYCDTDNLDDYGLEIKKYLRDRIPFLGWAVGGVEQITTKGHEAKGIGQELKMKLQHNEGHVFLLLGNLGSGKSTFLKRLYNFILDEHTRKHLIWLELDFWDYNEEGGDLQKFINKQIEDSLKKKYSHLKLHSNQVLMKIYEEELNENKEGKWYLIKDNEEKLNDKITEFFEIKLNDKYEHLKKVLKYLKVKGFVISLVFDNVDQRTIEIQERIFNFATSQANELNSLLILSLRDETFYNNRNTLPRNAYGNVTPYQIVPPDVLSMIKKRLDYVKNKENGLRVSFDFAGKPMNAKLGDIIDGLEETVINPSTREVFEKLSSGNMRNALKCFDLLVSSGHTNVGKLIIKSIATKQERQIHTHEVIKSIGLSNFETYDSNKSMILNLFRTFDDGFFSHFISIWILQTLEVNLSKKFNHDISAGYIPIDVLFNMLHPYCKDEISLRKVLIPLLESYLIESDIGSRRFGEKNFYDKVGFVKLTPTGKFYTSNLVGKFEYLELIMQDTSIFDEDIYKVILANHISIKNGGKSKEEYWKLRFENVNLFLSYLSKQEENDLTYIDHFNSYKIMGSIRALYQRNKQDLVQRLGLKVEVVQGK